MLQTLLAGRESSESPTHHPSRRGCCDSTENPPITNKALLQFVAPQLTSSLSRFIARLPEATKSAPAARTRFSSCAVGRHRRTLVAGDWGPSVQTPRPGVVGSRALTPQARRKAPRQAASRVQRQPQTAPATAINARREPRTEAVAPPAAAARSGKRRRACGSWSAFAGKPAVMPNPSFNPRPATAGAVSPACGVRSIIAVRAYAACLRSRG
jgi:hypothetical protein